MNLSAPFPNLNKACWGCSCSAAAGAGLCRGPGRFASTNTLISACGTDSCEAGPGSGQAGVWMLCCTRHEHSGSTPTGPALPVLTPQTAEQPQKNVQELDKQYTVQLWGYYSWVFCHKLALHFQLFSKEMLSLKLITLNRNVVLLFIHYFLLHVHTSSIVYLSLIFCCFPFEIKKK